MLTSPWAGEKTPPIAVHLGLEMHPLTPCHLQLGVGEVKGAAGEGFTPRGGWTEDGTGTCVSLCHCCGGQGFCEQLS